METYEVVSIWQEGTVQEIIPDRGETLEEAIRFVSDIVKGHRPDLFFYLHEVYEKDGKYYFTFWKAPAGTEGGLVDIDF